MRRPETSGRMARRCEQAEDTGLRHRLRPTVRAQLAAHVADVRADRVHREGQLAGDLRRGQVGRQISQYPDLALAQRLSQPRGLYQPGGYPPKTPPILEWLPAPPDPHGPSCKQAEDLGGQGRVLGAVPGVTLEQRLSRMDEEREEHEVGLGQVQRTLYCAPGSARVAERVARDRLQQGSRHYPDRMGSDGAIQE